MTCKVSKLLENEKWASSWETGPTHLPKAAFELCWSLPGAAISEKGAGWHQFHRCSRCFLTSFFLSPSVLPVPVRRSPRSGTPSCSMCRPPRPLPRGLDPPFALLLQRPHWEHVGSGKEGRSTFLTLTRTTHQRSSRLLWGENWGLILTLCSQRWSGRQPWRQPTGWTIPRREWEEGEVPGLLDDHHQRLNVVVVHHHPHGGFPHMHPKQLRFFTLLDVLPEEAVAICSCCPFQDSCWTKRERRPCFVKITWIQSCMLKHFCSQDKKK